MKKLLFVLPVILAGCAGGDSGDSMNFNPRKYNEKCADVQEVEVFQTLNKGALASVCERGSYGICMGHTVFVIKQGGVELWDKKRIKAPKNKCIVYDGVYKYTSIDERGRTVPIVNFEYKYSASSEDEVVERMEDIRSNVYHECLDDANEEFKNQKDKNIKTCECFADLILEKILEKLASEDNTEQSPTGDKFMKNLISETEKQCGKLPKSLKL